MKNKNWLFFNVVLITLLTVAIQTANAQWVQTKGPNVGCNGFSYMAPIKNGNSIFFP